MAQLLGDLEKAILTAILNQGNRAYGVKILTWLQENELYSATLPAIYTSLTRLESKGLLTSKIGEASPERGGRAKTYFSVTGTGQKALQTSLTFAEALRAKLQAI